MDELLDLHESITEQCLQAFYDSDETDPIQLSIKIMDDTRFPMHAPVHHYLVPAVLLTWAGKVMGVKEGELKENLAVASTRGLQVPGGTCGSHGACGASVGVGVFFSLMLKTTPLSIRDWPLVNQSTANALLAIASAGGPRCCKRCTWLSIMSAKTLIRDTFHMDLPVPVKLVCHFHERNAQCIRARCPFFVE